MHLYAHPGGHAGAAATLEAHAVRGADGGLCLGYRLKGEIRQLRLPAPTDSARRDGLWRHTCFEAFVATPGAPAYFEFNFSPSGEWAAYGFSDYRADMTPLAGEAIADVRWRRGRQQLELDIVLRPEVFIPAAAPLRLGLAAVIEQRSGTISYWALRHPEGPPDFHHPSGFALELPGAVARGAARP